MNKVLRLFFDTLEKSDQKQFKKYVFVLLLGSMLSVVGIGAVIPFINILMQPDKVMSLSFFHVWQYRWVVFLLTCTMISAFAIKNLSSFFLYKYQSKFLFGLVAKTQKRLFSGYMSHNYEYHLNRNTANLIKIINNETTLLANYVVAPIGTLLTELFSSGFVVMALLYLNPGFTASIALSLIAIVTLFMKVIRKKLKYFADERARSWSAMTEAVLNGLSGIKEAKLYHRESFYINQFTKEADVLRQAAAFQYTYSQTPRMMIEFTGLAVVMSVLCAFIFLGHDPRQMFMLLGVFGVAAAQLLPSVNRLTQSLVQIRYGLPALQTIHSELRQAFNNQGERSVCAKSLPFVKEISLSNITYAYADGTKALNDVSIKIQKGKKTALVGASGAGKTTLVDLLMGLYQPKSGKIIVDGISIKSSEQLASFQKLFGYIPQTIPLFDKTIAENIAFGISKDEIDKKKVWRCLEMAQLKGFVENLKGKEQAHIGEGGVRLSGGQRQRLGIARALYRDPEILVMDEATSALDNQTEKSVTDVVLNFQGMTILTIAHRLTTIKDYDLIYVLEKGKVIGSDTYNELKSDCIPFAKILNCKSNG